MMMMMMFFLVLLVIVTCRVPTSLTITSKVLAYNEYVHGDPLLGIEQLRTITESSKAVYTLAFFPPGELLAEVLTDSGHFNEAITKYTDALNIWPNRTSLYAGRARVYETLGDYDSADADYQKVIDLSGENADSRDYQDAMAYFAKSLRTVSLPNMGNAGSMLASTVGFLLVMLVLAMVALRARRSSTVYRHLHNHTNDMEMTDFSSSSSDNRRGFSASIFPSPDPAPPTSVKL
eukprot:m.163273 g.163273  ORF g.163273 m.163273 type:complete len:234 (+) comp24910_c0_seq3:2-703(+)